MRERICEARLGAACGLGVSWFFSVYRDTEILFPK